MRTATLENRVREVAKEFRSSHRICKRQALEFAREWVANWERTFSAEGLKEAAQRTNA